VLLAVKINWGEETEPRWDLAKNRICVRSGINLKVTMRRALLLHSGYGKKKR
jgi:hypothetical protein